MTEKSEKKHKPTIWGMFQIPIVGGGRISPDGGKILYRMAYADNFKANQLEVYSYLYDAQTDQTCGFTKTGIVSEIRWLNNQSLALLKSVDHNGFQIHIFEGLIGEGRQITDHPGGIETFEPFGNGFIYIAEKTTEHQVARESKYGIFVNVEEEECSSALYYIDTEKILDHRRNNIAWKETENLNPTSETMRAHLGDNGV